MNKTHKMDQHLISAEQHERSYFMRKYRVPAKKVKEVIAEIGTISRDEIMIRLVELGLIQSKVKKKEVKDQKFKNSVPYGRNTR